MTAPLDHVTIAATDLTRSVGFYEAALTALGLVRLAELVDEEEDDAELEAAGWGEPDGRVLVWVVTSEVATCGVHVGLRAATREAVEAFHAAALDAGGAEHSAPRRWPLYRRGEFNAIVRDPQGNLVEAVAPE
ncbi:VOC family protein [uncultured Jatrophihabitans sp.]|uniref:VOC family protein n=1 Tax=uncultured Jatrophihabitans sp. TaxID=1610747 RepID=UPI0035CBD19C